MRLRIVLALLVLAVSSWLALPAVFADEEFSTRLCCSDIKDCGSSGQGDCRMPDNGECSPEQSGECKRSAAD